MSDETRREWLRGLVGQASMRGLSTAALDRALDDLRARGAFKDAWRRATGVRGPLIAKIRAQLAALELPESYALAIAARSQKGKAPSSLRWCSAPLLRRVIRALAIHDRRSGATDGGS